MDMNRLDDASRAVKGLDAATELVTTQAERAQAEKVLRFILDVPEGEADPEIHAAWLEVKARLGLQDLRDAVE